MRGLPGSGKHSIAFGERKLLFVFFYFQENQH